MGQSQDPKAAIVAVTRAAAVTWAPGASAVRCTCCGEPLDGGSEVVTARLRGIVYDYCDGDCRDRHAAAVMLLAERCERCDADADGDTGRCAEHLDDRAESGSYPLAS